MNDTFIYPHTQRYIMKCAKEKKCWICGRTKKSKELNGSDPECVFEDGIDTDVGEVSVCVPCLQIMIDQFRKEMKNIMFEAGIIKDD